MKQKVITPTKGICNTIPDMICADNELADSFNIEYRDEALRPIQDLASFHNFDGVLMCVHHLNNGDKIYIQKLDTGVKWTKIDESGTSTKGNLQVTNPISAQTVGNTLIINTQDGMKYFIWQGTYKYIGDRIPEQKFKAYLYAEEYDLGEEGRVHRGLVFESEKVGYDGIIKYEEGKLSIISGQEDAYRNLIVSTYYNAEKLAHERKTFTRPFFAMSAVELYDGSYIYHSCPIPLFPSVRKSAWANMYTASTTHDDTLAHSVVGYKLHCSQNTDYTNWTDIVRGVTLFITDQVALYETSGLSYKIVRIGETEANIHDTVSGGSQNNCFYREQNAESLGLTINNGFILYIDALVSRAEDDILKDMREQGAFFKLCDLGTRILANKDVSTLFGPHDIDNITTSQRLNKIDYHTHSTLKTEKKIYNFNHRINLVSPTRTLFEGFDFFMPYTTEGNLNENNYSITVGIDTPDGVKYVNKTFSSWDVINGQDTWFYYPDPRAKQVWINGTAYPLTEHKGLNGAYIFARLPESGFRPDTGSHIVSIDNEEELGNYIVQSDVDNPFYFPAEGYVRVGQGEIIGMAGLTTALSQDAYKVATTIVFTTQGIWALQISADGQYSSVPPPFSREVCSNPESITMIDNGVLFTSEKGLMLITDNVINCISEQLKGKFTAQAEGIDFANFIKGAKLAYDYKNNSIWIINRSENKQEYVWVYNLRQGTYARKEFVDEVEAVINDYPDNLIQIEKNHTAYSMLNSPDRLNDKNTYVGRAITRPLNFDEAIRLKSITDIKLIQDCQNNVGLEILSSNDCKNWQKINSIRGRGFNFYVFKFTFSDIKATDTMAGIVVTYETRQENKIRGGGKRVQKT